MIQDKDFLTVNKVLAIISNSVKNNKPFSLVRVGDGENLILSQDSVMKMQEVLKQKWVIRANKGQKGVTLPNLQLRNEMVKAIINADLIGIPYWKNDPIKANQDIKRPLTEAVFKHYNIQPKLICHTFINRVLVQKKEFWDLLKGKRILLIGEWADKVKPILERKPYNLNIARTLPFSNYNQLEKTLEEIVKRKRTFDIGSCQASCRFISKYVWC